MNSINYKYIYNNISMYIVQFVKLINIIMIRKDFINT